MQHIDPLDLFGQRIVKSVFTPENLLEAALDACDGTIRFVEDYPNFEACYPKRHGSSVIYIHEVYRKFVPQGEIGFLYTTVEGNMKMGDLADLKGLNCYEPLINYSVRVALNLDHASLNGIHKPTAEQAVTDAIAKHITDKMTLLTLLQRYYTDREIVNCVDSKDFEQLVHECRENICADEATPPEELE